jgi:hypothetical protein
MNRLMQRNERGATALVVGMSAVLLFSMGALAVDLGNAFFRKRDAQTQADFAALAGASDLPADSTAPSASDPAVQAVAEYLVENHPQDDTGTAYPAVSTVAGNVVDGDQTNGEVCYGTWKRISPEPSTPPYYDCAQQATSKLAVLTPQAEVDFGLAGVLGPEYGNTTVFGVAGVGLRSPGMGVMPVYAVDGCDYGPQTVTDPAGGQTIPVTRPPMEFQSDTNDAVLDSLTPASIALNEVSGLTVNGNKLTGVTKIGFFREKDVDTPDFVEQALPAIASPNPNNNTAAITSIPTGVTSVEDVWWVRVFKPGTAQKPVNQWSSAATALPLRVGEAVLECESGSSDGNFGTLRLPRAGGDTGDDLSMNFATPLEFSLARYPDPAPDICTGLSLPAVHVPDEADLVEGQVLDTGTNCVPTDPGLPALSATEGLIKGVNGEDGRLEEPTSTGCDPNGGSDQYGADLGGSTGTVMINDDILTCFFTDDSVTIDQISKPSYSGPAVISPKVFSSPRFFWLPVVAVDPVNGTSQEYSIVDFRPAFITDQPLNATKVNRYTGTTTHNGLLIESGQLKTLKVVFFDIDALPETVDNSGPTTEWLGFGPKVITLTD